MNKIKTKNRETPIVLSLKKFHHPKFEKNKVYYRFQWKFGSSLQWDYSLTGWWKSLKISQMSQHIVFVKWLMLNLWLVGPKELHLSFSDMETHSTYSTESNKSLKHELGLI